VLVLPSQQLERRHVHACASEIVGCLGELGLGASGEEEQLLEIGA
jgi:hypothetical protein